MPRKKPTANTSRKGQAAPRNAGGHDSESTAADQVARFPVVGIGASAGGLEALEELFADMPTDSGMAFVVISHQHPSHTSLLPELLGKKTGMTVIEAADGTQLEANHVYIGPPGGYLALLKGALHRMETDPSASPKLPIDYFFRSLAEDQKERAICIVLSGTGTDGTLGLKAIKGESGMAMVEEPHTAKYSGMPSSAIATGLADYVLPPAAMPEKLVAYVDGPYMKDEAVAPKAPSVTAEPLQKIFVLLRSRTGHDFSAYKSNTLHRRIERRMNVHQIRKPDDYVRFLQENSREIDSLFKELLISVTNFFRDPDAWEALKPVIAKILHLRSEDHTFRAWVPGCATGEEAFSIAILLRELMDEDKRSCDVQIFGTDLDSEAIDKARVAQYPDGIGVDLSPQQLERFFIQEDGSFRIRKEIREMAVFAPQNVIKDPPFTKLDLISCRNLLIYLNTDLQRKLLPIFHYALKPGGILFLGPSETIGGFTDFFEPIDKRWKIFRRKEGIPSVHAMPEMPAHPETGDEPSPRRVSGISHVRDSHRTAAIERYLLDRFAPASVLVNQSGDIAYIHGRTGAYLEPAQGEPRNNVLEMAREGLQLELSAAMRECVRTKKDVQRQDICIKNNGESIHLDLSVAMLHVPESLEGMLVVTLSPPAVIQSKSEPRSERREKEPENRDRIAQLEREVRHLRESHQATLEALETSNEDLKSSNEELQSTNEELQSTNEELETSKEEMQSLNEELTTVNTELQSKVEELSQSNDDMQNLLNSTDIATIFLDNKLNIKRFTDQAHALVKVRRSDVGRPISELNSTLKAANLARDCREVIKTLVFRETEVETMDGGCYLMRIMPYRTAENVIDGLVLTFVDIAPVKRAEEAGETARAYFRSIVNTVREPLLVLDSRLRVVSANKSFYRLFRSTPKQTEGELIYELGAGQWNIPQLRRLLEEILSENTSFEDYETETELPKLGKRTLLLNARRLEQPGSTADLILLAMEDMTSGGNPATEKPDAKSK